MYVRNRKGKVWILPNKEAIARVKVKEVTEMSKEEILEHLRKTKTARVASNVKQVMKVSKEVRKAEKVLQQAKAKMKSKPLSESAESASASEGETTDWGRGDQSEIPLDQLTDDELKVRAKEEKVKGWAQMKRESLMKALG